MMNLTPEQIVAANKSNLETLVGLTSKAFAGVEQLIELNMAAAKSTLADSHSNAQTVMSVKDAQDLLSMQASMFQPLAEKMVIYNRHLYEIATTSGQDVGAVVQEQFAKSQQLYQDMFENMAKNAPAGSESAVAAFRTAVSAGTSALESVQKAVKQATDMVDSNVKIMSANALGAGKSATKKK
ncbi:MAG: phasin family protein [Betaproteobacteria bacterium]|jgi:phasin family protein